MNQTLVTIVLAVLLGLVGAYTIKTKLDHWKLGKTTDKLNSKLMEANLDLGKAKTRFGEAALYYSKLEKDLKKNIKALNSKITDYGELRARYNVLKKGGRGSVEVVKGSIIETEQEHTPGSLYLAQTKKTLVEIDQLPGKYKDHRIEINVLLVPRMLDGIYPDYAWSYMIDLSLKAQLVRTITADGALNHYLNLWEYNPETGKVLGKLEITDFTVISQQPDKAKFFWWSPHLDIGAAASWEELYRPVFGATIGFSAMGWGKTKNDLSWRFLRVAANLSDSIGIDFTPALWNAGSALPLLSNIWIAPFYRLGLNDNNSLGLMLNVVM